MCGEEEEGGRTKDSIFSCLSFMRSHHIPRGSNTETAKFVELFLRSFRRELSGHRDISFPSSLLQRRSSWNEKSREAKPRKIGGFVLALAYFLLFPVQA